MNGRWIVKRNLQEIVKITRIATPPSLVEFGQRYVKLSSNPKFRSDCVAEHISREWLSNTRYQKRRRFLHTLFIPSRCVHQPSLWWFPVTVIPCLFRFKIFFSSDTILVLCKQKVKETRNECIRRHGRCRSCCLQFNKTLRVNHVNLRLRVLYRFVCVFFYFCFLLSLFLSLSFFFVVTFIYSEFIYISLYRRLSAGSSVMKCLRWVVDEANNSVIILCSVVVDGNFGKNHWKRGGNCWKNR